MLPTIEIFLLSGIAAALLLILAAPVAERRGGHSAVTAIVVVSFFLLGPALIVGVLIGTRLGMIAAAIATAILAWSSISYIGFRAVQRSARLSKQSTSPPPPGANCQSRKTSGTSRVDGPDQRTWRTYLFTLYSTSPSDGELVDFAKAWGGAYFVVYFTTGVVEVNPSVAIICEEGNGSCLADGSETNPNSLNDPPVRVKVVNSISSSGPRVRVAVAMGAAVRASGGPSVAIAPGGVGPSISFSDASLDNNTPMGTYRWICEETEG